MGKLEVERTVAVLLEFQWGLSVSSIGAEGGLTGCPSLLWWPCLLSTWLRRRQIFKPAQNLSNVSRPLEGVTFLRLSMTPLGRPFVPSSCQRLSISTNWKQVLLVIVQLLKFNLYTKKIENIYINFILQLMDWSKHVGNNIMLNKILW